MNIDKYAYIRKYPDVALEIRHEALVDDPQAVFTKILKLTGLEQSMESNDLSVTFFSFLSQQPSKPHELSHSCGFISQNVIIVVICSA